MPKVSGPTVLIVEDDDVVSMVLSEVLTEAGYVLHGTAKTADAALALSPDPPPPDFAVVDIDLNRIPDGVTVGQTLIAKGVSVLFATGFFEAYRHEMSAAGALACLVKPYTPEDVVNALAALEAIQRGERPPLPRMYYLQR